MFFYEKEIFLRTAPTDTENEGFIEAIEFLSDFFKDSTFGEPDNFLYSWAPQIESTPAMYTIDYTWYQNGKKTCHLAVLINLTEGTFFWQMDESKEGGSLNIELFLHPEPITD